MYITHFGHACVLLEIGSSRILVDPGAYSSGFENARGLAAVVITHDHADHIDVQRMKELLANNPAAVVIANASVAAALPEDVAKVTLQAGEKYDAQGVSVEAFAGEHAVIHPLLPNVANTGYVFDGSVWHPGDSFAPGPTGVDILLLPIGGPWMRLADAIDFQRTVKPRVSIAIHEAGLSSLHRGLHGQLLTKLAPEGTTYTVLEPGVPSSF